MQTKSLKNSFTLIEVLIALGLTSILMATLLFWYKHITTTKHQFKEMEWTILEERYLHQKLGNIFSSLPCNSENFKQHFFTSDTDQRQIVGNSLVFYFDNGPNLDPQLANFVLGRIYLDAQSKTICLGVWPLKGKDPSYTLPLLNQVEKVAFSFYFPPQNHFIVDPEKVSRTVPQSGWQIIWKDEYQQLPALIKVDITRMPVGDFSGRTLEYVFDIPSSMQSITYYQPEKKP